MNIVRTDPFRELRSLQDEMTRLFTGVTPSRVGREDMFSGEWLPKVDVYENRENLVLEAELPGMARDDFELTIENNVLTLSGSRKFEKRSENDNYHRVERAYGSFTRSFTLPATVTADGAKAEFNNGVLTVKLAKREETRARKIEVLGDDTQPKTIETENRSKAAEA